MQLGKSSLLRIEPAGSIRSSSDAQALERLQERHLVHTLPRELDQGLLYGSIAVNAMIQPEAKDNHSFAK